MGWGKAQVSVKSQKIFDNKRGLSKLSNHYIDKKIRKLIRYDWLIGYKIINFQETWPQQNLLIAK